MQMTQESHEFKAGIPTLCAPYQFVEACNKTFPIMGLVDVRSMGERMWKLFTEQDRWEYIVRDSTTGDIIAIMVVGYDACDAHTGLSAVYPIMACSLQDNALQGGWRFLIRLGKQLGAAHAIITRTTGMEIHTKYKDLRNGKPS